MNEHRLSKRLLAAVGALILAVIAGATLTFADTNIPWRVVGSGGNEASSTNYRLGSTAGQSSAIGSSASTNYRLGAGYWYGAQVCADFDNDLACNSVDPDDDNDGCTDVREALPKAQVAQGGGRNPLHFWDFFDVHTGTGLVRNKQVNAADIAATVARFGATDTGPGTFNRFSNPLSTPTAAITPSGARANYHPGFDRGGTSGPNPWNLLAANGNIAAGELANLVAQFGNNCN